MPRRKTATEPAEVKPKSTRGRKPRSTIAGDAVPIAPTVPTEAISSVQFTDPGSPIKVTVTTEIDVVGLVGAIAYGIGALFADNQK